MGESLMRWSSPGSGLVTVQLRRAALFRIAVYWMGGFLLLSAHSVWADEATDWLNRAATAAKQLNYSGVYVYHHGEHVEVMRVSHRKDASGEQ